MGLGMAPEQGLSAPRALGVLAIRVVRFTASPSTLCCSLTHTPAPGPATFPSPLVQVPEQAAVPSWPLGLLLVLGLQGVSHSPTTGYCTHRLPMAQPRPAAAAPRNCSHRVSGWVSPRLPDHVQPLTVVHHGGGQAPLCPSCLDPPAWV